MVAPAPTVDPFAAIRAARARQRDGESREWEAAALAAIQDATTSHAERRALATALGITEANETTRRWDARAHMERAAAALTAYPSRPSIVTGPPFAPVLGEEGEVLRIGVPPGVSVSWDPTGWPVIEVSDLVDRATVRYLQDALPGPDGEPTPVLSRGELGAYLRALPRWTPKDGAPGPLTTRAMTRWGHHGVTGVGPSTGLVMDRYTAP